MEFDTHCSHWKLAAVVYDRVYSCTIYNVYNVVLSKRTAGWRIKEVGLFDVICYIF